MNPHASSNIRNIEMRMESYVENVKARIIIVVSWNIIIVMFNIKGINIDEL